MSYDNDILETANLDLPWSRLDGCNILITGATGLIGSSLIDVLMAHQPIDYHVYALGRNEKRLRALSNKYNNGCFSFIKHDVAERLTLDTDFHYIIHCAGGAAPVCFAQTPVEVMTDNIMGVNNLLDYGRLHNMRRMLFLSSGEVYGEGDGRAFTEDYIGYVNPLLPRSCYPVSKRASETLCISYVEEYGLDVVIARPSHVYGPSFTETDNRAYAQFLRNVLNNSDVVIKSKGDQFRSWCYVIDCVSALLYILLKGDNGQAYNIADAQSNVSIYDFANFIANIGGKKVVMESAEDEEKKGYNLVKKSVFVTDKLHTLGWSPKTHLKEGLSKTIEALK